MATFARVLCAGQKPGPERSAVLDGHALRRAADQLKTNSVIQAHYGDVLLKVMRYDEAIAAFSRALAGDGEEIDRGDIDKKIKAAKQKTKK